MAESCSNSRLETFCDGIFAIAITLLILEIKIPETEQIHGAFELRQTLLSQWPSWLAFLLTFITLLIAWVNHHHMAAQLDKTSNTFIYANGLLMLTVIIFPFSTGVLGRFLDTPYATTPIILYCLTTFLHNVGWVTVFTSAVKPKDLSKDPTNRKKILQTKKDVTYACVFNLAVTILAFWFPIVSLCLVTSAWLFYLLSGIIHTSME
jgi:uncharacterized membrane protein